MDNEGYPEPHELEQITNWDYRDYENLIDFIESLWHYDDAFKKEWVKDDMDHEVLRVTLCTLGWSGNEDIIDALLSNTLFKILWYVSWRRGGKFVFEINPINIK